MFMILATKPLNDNTQGYRFNMLGTKGIIRKRKYKSRGFKVEKGQCMTAYHLGKRTIYVERDENSVSSRMLRHFAG